MRKHCSRRLVCLRVLFFWSFLLPFRAERFVEKYEQPTYYCCSQRGIWPGYKGNGTASLGSLIPCFKTPLFWVISPTPNRTALDGRGEERNPVHGKLSSKSSTSRLQQARYRNYCRPSPVSCRRLERKGQRGEMWFCLWLRRRTHHRHIQCSRSLFCLARWPALFSHTTLPVPHFSHSPLL